MKIIWATLGGLALKLLFAALLVLIVAAALMALVPAALPAIGSFTWYNAFGVAGLLFLARGVFK
jgi:hypothetical protein